MSTLKFDLRCALEDYEAKTGIRLTYEMLSQSSGLSVDALKSMATRDVYNASLRSIACVCDALNLNPIQYFRWSGGANED